MAALGLGDISVTSFLEPIVGKNSLLGAQDQCDAWLNKVVLPHVCPDTQLSGDTGHRLARAGFEPWSEYL